MRKSYWDTSDKIELLTENPRQPNPASVAFAWPESIDDHWERLYHIRKQAYEGRWKYRNFLPRRKRTLALYRRAWDDLKVPLWVQSMSRSELRIGMCVDDQRRPIAYEEAIREKVVEAAEGIARRQASNAVRHDMVIQRDQYQRQTQDAIRWFRKECFRKLVYWEQARPTGDYHNHFDDGRALFVQQVKQKIQESQIGKQYLLVLFVDKNMRQHNITVCDFKAWVEDDCLYITEWPYNSTSINETRPVRRIRLRRVIQDE